MNAYSIPEFAEAIFNETMITLPYHLFAYIPFWNHMRVSSKKLPLYLAAVQLAYMAVFTLLSLAGVPLSYIRLTTVLMYGVPFFAAVKMEWGKVAFLYVFTADYVMLTHTAASFLEPYISSSPGGFYSWQTGLLNLVLFLLTLPFMLRYFFRTVQNVFEINAPGIWNKVWLLPVFNSVLVYLTGFSSKDAAESISGLLLPLFLMGSMFLIYYYVIQSIRQLQSQVEAQEKIRHLEQIASVQANEYKLLKSHIEETRRARHDLRQHLRAIQGYIDSEDFPGLENYITDVAKNIPLDTPHAWTGNPAVDAILGFYAQKALDAGIDIEIVTRMDATSIIPEHELCVLLGNLLENALEACAADVSEKSVIRVHAQQTGHTMLAITVDNTCSSPPDTDQGALLSSKHPGSGIGTESVRAIAERYHGDARFEWKDGMFYASVVINP